MDNEKKLREALKPVIISQMKDQPGIVNEDFVEKTIRHIFGVLKKARSKSRPSGDAVLKKELENLPQEMKDLIKRMNADALKK
jgi:hypothetical protein